MKKIKTFIIFLMSLFIFSSCETYSQTIYTEDEIEVVSTTSNVTFSTVITYGVPFYIDNIISYYLYNGIYYYPYYWNNVLYLKPYRYIQPRGFRYIPPRHHRPDHRFMQPHHNNHINRPGNHRPGNRLPDVHSRPSRPDSRPNFGNQHNHQRPNINTRPNQRPMVTPRSSTRTIQPSRPQNNSRGHFGGRR